MSDPGPSTPRQIPCLTPEQATYGHFRSEHLLPNTPCLFPASYTRDWPIRRYIAAEGGSIDYEALEQRFGSLKVSCAECGGVESAEVLSKSAEPPIDNFLDLLRLWQSGRGRSKYLKDWHLPLAIHHGGARNPDGDKRSVIRKGKERVRDELYEVPPVWLDDWMNEYEGSERDDDFRFVYAGGGDTFTPLHRDVYWSYSISTQLFGRKRWYLFPPDCTATLRPLLKAAEREDTSVNCDAWSDASKAEFRERGMVVVEQEVGESIFIPSGWYHSVHNLTHPTFSLNHNWANAHNLAAIYRSLSDEVTRCREAIADVREMLIDAVRRRGGDTGPEGEWRGEWEETVNRLVEQSEGWSWPTFWRMTRHALSNLGLSLAEVEARADESRWPTVPSQVRPPVSFVIEQVQPLVDDFRRRQEAEWRWLPGLDEVVSRVEHELQRLEAGL
ncbi:hypothetical protein BMF94_2489 [Rhodotorula taiwanensis]|uniref:JmjC domain-containing protein n=1 Tax=Rhodotorula taiwanensis TaxID=741276 RepID=A0A2S5BBY7_9BASI|nr:hypothetical protein BMF94_2489 [Rhodotorula taiwanensis]